MLIRTECKDENGEIWMKAKDCLAIAIWILLHVPAILFIGSHRVYAEEQSVFFPGVSPIGPGDRICFYNIAEGGTTSDMIFVESNGRWGLIDAGHRFASEITDEMGEVYRTDVSALSCTVEGRNGRDAMIYMIENLGVNHLDFIIGTHAHSDHIGGIPEIAELEIVDDNGGSHSLIDESTMYFYKSYFHTNALDDDFGDTLIERSWHSQAFYYQAKEAVSCRGGNLLDVGCGIQARGGEILSADQSTNLAVLESSEQFRDVSYSARATANPYDDRFSFSWGNMRFDLYNLFAVNNAGNENVNSLVTVITCNGQKIYLGGDMDTQMRVEQKLAEVIRGDHGSFSLAKLSHHGIYNGSNSKAFIDFLQPRIMVSTNHWTDFKAASPGGVYSSVKYYASRKYGTEFYGVGASGQLLVVDLFFSGVELYCASGWGEEFLIDSAERCKDSLQIMDGWSLWGEEIISQNINNWYFFEKNEAVIGWHFIEGKWYYFSQDGFMQCGWLTQGGQTYYLDSAGVMLTGLQQIGGTYYYFGSTGTLIKNGWVQSGGDWYYVNSNGRVAVSQWVRYGREWCYLGADCKMLHDRFVQFGNDWYYMNNKGYMVTDQWVWGTDGWRYMSSDGRAIKRKWKKTGDAWYYLKADGIMAANEWLSMGKNWYYMKANGSMASAEWVKDSMGWCWLKKNGELLKNKWIWNGGVWYYLGADGYMFENKWIESAGKWFWLGSSGRMAQRTWLKYGVNWYYLKADGRMAANEWITDGGKKYYISESGIWKA